MDVWSPGIFRRERSNTTCLRTVEDLFYVEEIRDAMANVEFWPSGG
jgi:hypothetical protein